MQGDIHIYTLQNKKSFVCVFIFNHNYTYDTHECNDSYFISLFTYQFLVLFMTFVSYFFLLLPTFLMYLDPASFTGNLGIQLHYRQKNQTCSI